MIVTAFSWKNLVCHQAHMRAFIGGRVAVKVVTEVPVNQAGEEMQRFGNRYYPTTIEVGEFHVCTSEEARELAALLIKAADTADDVDKPDTAPCGHWAPCDCGATK